MQLFQHHLLKILSFKSPLPLGQNQLIIFGCVNFWDSILDIGKTFLKGLNSKYCRPGDLFCLKVVIDNGIGKGGAMLHMEFEEKGRVEGDLQIPTLESVFELAVAGVLYKNSSLH